MKVTVTLSQEEILFDIMSRSRSECASISDPEARYAAAAGSDRRELLLRLLADSDSGMRVICGRFLTEDYSRNVTNIPDTGEGTDDGTDKTLNYVFDFSPRRADGKAVQLKELMHSYLVDSVLGRFYIASGKPDFAQNHAKMASDGAAALSSLLYTKKEPIL